MYVCMHVCVCVGMHACVYLCAYVCVCGECVCIVCIYVPYNYVQIFEGCDFQGFRDQLAFYEIFILEMSMAKLWLSCVSLIRNEHKIYKFSKAWWSSK